MTTTITSDHVEAYTLCPRKAFLLMTGAAMNPGPHDYELVVRAQAEANRQAHRIHLMGAGDVVPFSGPTDLSTGRDVLADTNLTADLLQARSDFLAKTDGPTRLGHHGYRPVRVIGTCAESRADVIGCAYQGLVLGEVQGQPPTSAALVRLKSPFLFVADTVTNKVIDKVGPFAASIRPFTVNGTQTLCFVNVNELLGFEIGDLKTGKKLHRVEVPDVKKGMVKRHGCPSHGIGLTPDEKEVWVVDAFNERVHVFDATAMPPKYVASVKLREQPGWITFSLDGKYAYPSTGEVIDTATKKIGSALADDKGGPVHSEKMVEIRFKDGVPIAAGDQFGLGRKK